ncbi:MAG TPA: hypothetical protein VKB25_07860 [Conexibacter sp.]|nr:hypothetical protein [Conexibacter sp.]
MSPKPKRELARQHLETARVDLDGERYGDALNAMFHAAEAAVVWLADHHGIETRRLHWVKAEAAERLHAEGATDDDHGDLLRDLNQGRKDYWYDGEELDPDELRAHLVAVEALVVDAERA